jgi:dinuclear metal center YbgI/SA1388 family protein
MTSTVGDWLRVLDDLYPPSWAEEWDASGLQVGDPDRPADRALVALDPTPEVVREAGGLRCGLLVTHHPLVFRPLSRLDARDPVARTVLDAVEAGVAVVAAHTNADVAPGGVSDALAEALGIRVAGPLQESRAGERVKLVTFVPAGDTMKVLDAVADAGAGVIGEYTHCSFRVRGTGTFLPSDRAHPAVGEAGALNEVEEDRLEIVVPAERQGAAVRSLLEAHPYEEVAYDVYPLAGRSGLGLGRVGSPDERMTAGELARRCTERLGAQVRVAGDPEREVTTVALCGGSGATLIPEALRAGAEAYVTGDVRHHQALEAAAAGMVVIDAGHFGTEWPFVPGLARHLAGAGLGEVSVSGIRTDPFASR